VAYLLCAGPWRRACRAPSRALIEQGARRTRRIPPTGRRSWWWERVVLPMPSASGQLWLRRLRQRRVLASLASKRLSTGQWKSGRGSKSTRAKSQTPALSSQPRKLLPHAPESTADNTYFGKLEAAFARDCGHPGAYRTTDMTPSRAREGIPPPRHSAWENAHPGLARSGRSV
jgi:hypothetical protein